MSTTVVPFESPELTAQIEAVAVSYCHQPSAIRTERERDYLTEQLASPYPLDYDALYFSLACWDLIPADQPFDLFVKAAYRISIMEHTPATAKRAAIKLANLAVSVLTFNMNEESDLSEEIIDAAGEAWQSEA